MHTCVCHNFVSAWFLDFVDIGSIIRHFSSAEYNLRNIECNTLFAIILSACVCHNFVSFSRVIIFNMYYAVWVSMNSFLFHKCI